MPDDANIREYQPSDAAEVARMWNESDGMWPGGFTRGVPFTAQRIQTDLDRSKNIALYLAIAGARVAGYCRLTESREEDGVAYVALLNVHPDYQRRGFARDLLKASLERTCREGFERLDLHTWAGNMRAVPLYKKSGYFWVRETSVHMENYLPLLLRTPFLAGFFARHDWYRTQVRDLAVREDDVSLGGMRIYPYRWEADGESYEATIDAEGKGLTALRTPEWRVACQVPRHRLHPGIPQTVRWEIERLDGKEGHVTLIADSEAGATLHHEAQATIRGLFTTEAIVSADPTAEPKPHGLPAHRITTSLVLDGTLLRLNTGQRIGPAVEAIATPRFWSVPGQSKTLRLRLRNHLDEAVRGTLRLTPPPDVRLAEATGEFEAPVGGYGGVATPLTVSTAGGRTLHAHLDLRGEHTRASYALEPIPIVTCEPGRSTALVLRDHATVENEVATLTVHLRGGGWELHLKRAPDQSMQGSMLLGTPFDHAQRERLRFEATTQHDSSGDVLVLRAGAWGFPDVTVEHSFRLVGASLVRIQTAVMNSSPEDHHFQCASHFGGWDLRDPKIAVPWATGLVVDRAPGFPDWREEKLEAPAALAEQWVALVTDEVTLGCFWESASRIEIGRGPSVTSVDLPVAAGQSAVFAPVYVVATLGDWSDVRDRWRDTLRPDAPAELGVERRALEIVAGKGGVLVPGKQQEVAVVSRYSKQLPMSLEVEAPDGWDVATDGETRDSVLEREQPQFVHLNVQRTAGSVLAALRVELAAGSMRQRFTLPLLDPGHGKVQVEQSEMSEAPVWSITNASYGITLAPSFGGAIRLDYCGENQLLSAFPEPRAFAWTRPWFGGLSPYVFLRGLERWEGFPDPGRLPHEQWEVTPVTEEGAGGTRWTGLSMRCVMTSAGMVGLTVRMDYFVPPSAPLVALRLHVENHSTTLLEGSAGVYAFLQPGGRLRARLAFERDERWEIERGPSSSDHGSGRWAAVHDPEAGVAVAMVSPKPHETIALDERDEGMHLSSSLHRVELKPGAKHESVSWLVLGESLQEVEAGQLLSEVVSLP